MALTGKISGIESKRTAKQRNSKPGFESGVSRNFATRILLLITVRKLYEWGNLRGRSTFFYAVDSQKNTLRVWLDLKKRESDLMLL